MTESIEQVVPEQDYAGLLETRGEPLFRLALTLDRLPGASWTKRHYFQLHTEADELESFLDDYGARYNRTYHTFTELTASIRGVALAGLSVEHLCRRLPGYAVMERLGEDERSEARTDLEGARHFVRRALGRLLSGLRTEGWDIGITWPRDAAPGAPFEDIQRFSLPRNVDQEDFEDEEQKVAEVASKYVQACQMLADTKVRRLEHAAERDEFLRRACTEEHARVYEATVHNLQSAYDTYVKNTVIEARDERLPLMRGHISASLHALGAVTHLTHFIERHENELRTEAAEQALQALVDRSEVSEVVVNRLLFWGDRFLRAGCELAEELRTAYTNVQGLEVELGDDITLHARPASLIVAIVNHYGTPVEMECGGQTCNAGSILELMIAVGSHPEARRYSFKGDEHPLRDIGLLFQSNLGEDGLDGLPGELGYLRS